LAQRQVRDSGIVISEDGWIEIDNRLKEFKQGLIIEAARIAHKEGHKSVDRTYVQKAFGRLNFPRSSSITWILRIVLGLLISLGLFQLGNLANLSLLNQPLLWVLPVFVIIFVLLISFIFKDFL